MAWVDQWVGEWVDQGWVGVAGVGGGWTGGGGYVCRFADNHSLMVEEVSEFCVVSVTVSEPAREGGVV